MTQEEDSDILCFSEVLYLGFIWTVKTVEGMEEKV